MRIAYVCADPGVPVFGRKGCSIHVQEVLRGLRREGATVLLFAARVGGPPPRGLERLPVHRLREIASGAASAREQLALSANPGLLDALEHAGPFDLVYERHALWSYAGMEYAEQAGVPGLLEVNAPLLEEQARYRQLVHHNSARWAVTRAYDAASTILAVSEGLADHIRRDPVARGKVRVVPNGVDPTRFAGDAETDGPGDPSAFTVGFVGSLRPWHGLDHLVGAFAEVAGSVPEARLLVVGDGPEREGIEGRLRQLGVAERTTITGAVDPDRIPGLLAQMDVATAPYPALDEFYFSPLKIFEYMAAGRAVVASSIGQINELISDGVTGLLCPPGDAPALARALRRLRNEPELRRRLGDAGRERITRTHTWDAVARRILDLARVDAVRRPGRRPERRQGRRMVS